jgi:excisionase family DNA binding protein
MADVDWITTAEAAELSGYDREYIRRLVRHKKVQARKFGTIWQIDRDSLLAYLQDSFHSTDERRGPKSN